MHKAIDNANEETTALNSVDPPLFSPMDTKPYDYVRTDDSSQQEQGNFKFSLHQVSSLIPSQAIQFQWIKSKHKTVRRIFASYDLQLKTVLLTASGGGGHGT